MSMLAEPRRKKNYVLNPRGKALYNDEDRFGSKMLQKMGWTKGKGLGAKENGSIDFVRVNFKCDAAGLGFEDRNDQWTEHEKGFNGLLSSLQTGNGAVETTEKSDDDDAPETIGFGFKNSNKKRKKLAAEISGQSLEEKSKQSKARVHYKKYTKGKDLSQYSEKELANIFGKKVDNILESEKSDNNTEDVGTITIDHDFKKKTKLQDNDSCQQALLSNEESDMLKTSSTSINDYFKRKMQEKNEKKNKINQLQAKDYEENQSVLPETNKSKRTKRKSTTNSISEDNDTLSNADENSYKKKRRKNIEENNETINEDVDHSALNVEKSINKKKNKVKKISSDEVNNLVSTETKLCYQSSLKIDLNVSVAVSEKNKSKKKRSVEKNSDADASKLNKMKANTEQIENFENQNTTKNASDTKETPTNSYKRKKRKNIEENNETTNEDVDHSALNVEKARNKKKSSDEVNNLVSTETKLYDQSRLKIDLNDSVAVNEKNKGKKKRSVEKNSDIDESKLNKVKANTEQIENCENQSTTENSSDTKETSTNESTVKFGKKIALSKENIQNWEDFNKCYKIYQISSFAAEKFRHFNACEFRNSNILDIDGYSLDRNMKLEIVTRVEDEKRIAQLWEGVINKYRKQNDNTIQMQQEQLPTSETILKPENKKNLAKNKFKERLKIMKKQKRRSVFKLGI